MLLLHTHVCTRLVESHRVFYLPTARFMVGPTQVLFLEGEDTQRLDAKLTLSCLRSKTRIQAIRRLRVYFDLGHDSGVRHGERRRVG